MFGLTPKPLFQTRAIATAAHIPQISPLNHVALLNQNIIILEHEQSFSRGSVQATMWPSC